MKETPAFSPLWTGEFRVGQQLRETSEKGLLSTVSQPSPHLVYLANSYFVLQNPAQASAPCGRLSQKMSRKNHYSPFCALLHVALVRWGTGEEVARRQTASVSLLVYLFPSSSRFGACIFIPNLQNSSWCLVCSR